MKLKSYTLSYDRLGVQRDKDVMIFSIQVIKARSCSLKLYPKDGSRELIFPMKQDKNGAGIFSVGLEPFDIDAYDYNYVIEETVVTDPYARRISGRESWGELSRLKRKENIKGSLYFSEFNWNNDTLPNISKQDMIMYKLHARGFTKGLRDKKYAGLFEGIKRRIPYFKDLGITTLEFMPIYEFEEIMESVAAKINYWGYCKGDYFAPKAAYLGAGNDPAELKKLIYKLHQNQIECILEMYFPQYTNPILIIDCLRFWSREYHVDGFHLICDAQTAQLAAQDLQLSGRKLFFNYFDSDIIVGERQKGPSVFSYNEEFTYAVRKMLNHHGGDLYDFTCQMRRQDVGQGFVNFAANYNGFTLNDLFSYTRKRNENNLDNNCDGNDYNYSNNCGEEGESKKKNVVSLRIRQIKNALALVFLAQGIPLIWMGDESGNSQQGNNNAYCQDNAIGWKNWENKLKNRQILQFTKDLIKFRNRHRMIHRKEPMKMYDLTGLGFPDLSYHTDTAWMADFSSNQPYIGMLYCNANESAAEYTREFIYMAYNFQLTPQKFALPVLPKGLSWHIAIDTRREASVLSGVLPLLERTQTFLVQAQSITVLVSRAADMENRGKQWKKIKSV